VAVQSGFGNQHSYLLRCHMVILQRRGIQNAAAL
jgi:hypothetical protein